VRNSAKGSSILFDYFKDSVIKGTSEVGKNIRDFAAEQGEPYQFGLNEGEVATFLAKRGFSKVQNVTSEDYKKAYFKGVNEGRTVSSLLNFAHAVIEEGELA
jgi:O-methyltransferase involved in polyketide biosynthesis